MKTKTKKTENVKTIRDLIKDRETFNTSIIAQDDDCDYDESGYVVCVIGDQAGLATYSHCSCYGTWTSITGGDYSASGNGIASWSWIGKVKELVKLAKANGDPHLPGRTASSEDYNYDHLQKVYNQILEWNKNKPKNKVK